ncbi:TIGR01213 family protein [Halovivax ruber XH-70]|uniref:tRNA pseudouridine synthase Pus10 n=1 Tax=Halovivax ruber (strain DSM 18193 / JCM 13892 / XH-70) TaxID=797302 RepID=L0I7Q4_HALRX|nr:tRNA pseudouridine(54/55) synthase Pus10 [Halovivax ruber]AGB14729.1 TIGR01213 family protein [Halovivax ruber XH-70]
MTLTDAAADLLAGGPVCDACLGRPFADRSFGLRNDERGRALRTTLALEADEPYEPVDPVECWVCEGYCGTFDALAEAVVETLDGVDFATYQVGTVVPPLVEENDRLLREDAGMEPDAGEPLKREVNREVGRRVGARTGAEVDFDRPDVLCIVDLSAFGPYAILEDGEAVTAHAVDRQINPAFVYGRYRKIERDIPQTEWPCRECGGSGTQLTDDGEEPCDYCGGSGYLYDTSIEETVRPHVVAAMDGREGTFHGAGREDVDARMLGTGRPFVLEVKHPHHRTPDVEALEAEINEAAAGAVEVEGLRLATHDMVERVKEHDASKRYRAAVQFDEPVSATSLDEAFAELEGTTVEQYTPQRVDHRRAELTRERTVYAIDGEPGITETMADSVETELLEPEDVDTTATIEVHGAGGLYIKELISGDDGRTEPSVAGLLDTGAEVAALDVLAVEGEDEPFERADYFKDEAADGGGESGDAEETGDGDESGDDTGDGE